MKAEQRNLKNESASYSPKSEPAPDFLGHLQERLGVDDRIAAAKLQFWMSTYQPGPAALAQSGAAG